jgi:hypothetical protein
MKNLINNFNLSTSTRKAGKLGLSKSAGVVSQAYEIAGGSYEAQVKEQFIIQVTALIETAEVDKATALRRYNRSNQVRFANQFTRISVKIATLSRALAVIKG